MESVCPLAFIFWLGKSKFNMLFCCKDPLSCRWFGEIFKVMSYYHSQKTSFGLKLKCWRTTGVFLSLLSIHLMPKVETLTEWLNLWFYFCLNEEILTIRLSKEDMLEFKNTQSNENKWTIWCFSMFLRSPSKKKKKVILHAAYFKKIHRENKMLMKKKKIKYNDNMVKI